MADEKTRSYEVLVGAVVIRTGRGRNEVVRVTRGKRINGKPSDERIKSLVRTGAIGKPGSTSSTVRHVVTKLGAADDPVAPPVQDVQPVPAPSSGMVDGAAMPNATVVPAGVGV